MPRFRLILAWLLLAALPLQGWAAAAMQFCGPAQRAAVIAEAYSPGADLGAHDLHAAHHDVQEAQAQHHEAGGSTSGEAQPVADGAHTCGLCAACCHGMALAQTQHRPAVSSASGAALAEPLVAVLARPSPVPDKPPRA